jgi:hypothetical protein
LYTVELGKLSFDLHVMVSRVDTQNWTVQRILLDTIGIPFSRITLSIFNWGSIELDRINVDDSYALIVSGKGLGHRGNIFLSLSTNRQIIPPSPWLSGHQLGYGDHQLTNLPTGYLSNTVMSWDHLAYIDGGKVFVLNYSSLIEQM